jgi:hypothetical protein
VICVILRQFNLRAQKMQNEVVESDDTGEQQQQPVTITPAVTTTTTGKSSSSSNKIQFSFDRNVVPQNWDELGKLGETTSELQQLGVKAYSTATLEENALQQLNRALDLDEQLRNVETQLKELQQQMQTTEATKTTASTTTTTAAANGDTESMESQDRDLQNLRLLQTLLQQQEDLKKQIKKKRKRQEDATGQCFMQKSKINIVRSST